MPPPRPNLLFIMTDHQRADSLGMVQSGVEVCPRLNALAAEGVCFTRAYTTCPLCVPARTALATGLYPTRNGVVFNDWRGLRAADHAPIHQLLAEAGYDVAHVGMHHVRVAPPLERRVPFAAWIDRADHAAYLAGRDIDADAREGLRPFRRTVAENQDGRTRPAEYSNTRVDVWPGPAEDFLDSFLCREAAAFVRRPRARPFALFLNLWAPHPPLRVPQPYASLVDPARTDLPANVGRAGAGEPSGRRRGVAAQLGQAVPLEQWRRVWAAHLGLVRLADDGIGVVLDALAAAGRWDDTVVCFTVDHGDHLGQHGMYQKMEMYEPAVRVPLVVRAPGAAARSFEQVVSHLDVMPTLLELMGLPVPGGLDGVSLAPAILTGASPPDRPAFCQYSGNPTLGDVRRAVIRGEHKYVYDPQDAPELYDLAADPLEMRNLADEPEAAGLRRELHGLCAAWGAAHGDWVRFG